MTDKITILPRHDAIAALKYVYQDSAGNLSILSKDDVLSIVTLKKNGHDDDTITFFEEVFAKTGNYSAALILENAHSYD